MSHTLAAARADERQRAREASLLSMIGTGETALDIGALEGYYSERLCSGYERVVALDLVKPTIPGVENVSGDVQNLQFADHSFDLVFCAEVLEHVPDVERAAREIARVTRKRAVIGVPYQQDLRIARVTCAACGTISNPWGHINTFDEHRLQKLFSTMKLERFELVGSSQAHTTRFATWLMDLGGNPWGTYDQLEPCPKCKVPYSRPTDRSLLQKIASGIAQRLNNVQAALTKPHGNWIHATFIAP